MQAGTDWEYTYLMQTLDTHAYAPVAHAYFTPWFSRRPPGRQAQCEEEKTAMAVNYSMEKDIVLQLKLPGSRPSAVKATLAATLQNPTCGLTFKTPAAIRLPPASLLPAA